MRSGAKQAFALLLGSQELHQERRATELEGKVSEIFLLFKLPIYRYLLGLLGNRDDAEEMMQEVFLSLYGTLQKGTRIDNVRAWVFRVAHNLAVNQQKRPRIIEALDEDQWWRLCQERSDPTGDSEQRLLREEKRTRVIKAP
jgi:RNA polymerase sigma-70 factor, ECF subfamily